VYSQIDGLDQARPSFWAKPSLSNWVSRRQIGDVGHRGNLEILTMETINEKNASQPSKRVDFPAKWLLLCRSRDPKKRDRPKAAQV
jgi:hypothetical protein